MVVELIPNGNLYQLINSQQSLDWIIRYQIAQDIANGLEYLHSLSIAHGDLTSLNILLSADMRAKITNFELTYVDSIRCKHEGISENINNVRWKAPEFLNQQLSTVDHYKKADMYSYGMVLWELASREIPYSDEVNETVVQGWIITGQTEDIPEDCPPSFATLISRCWEMRPESRPTIHEVVEQLTEICAESEIPLVQKSSEIEGLKYQSVPGDGHCLYHAVGLYIGEDVATLRRIVSDYLEARTNLHPFIRLEEGQTIEGYIQDIGSGREWADHIDIEVLQQVLDRPIVVIDPNGQIRNSREDIERFNGEPIFVSYNGHTHYDAYVLLEDYVGRDILNHLVQFSERPNI